MMRIPGDARGGRAITLACLLAATACYTSPPPEVVARAVPPRGAMMAVFTVDGGEHKGELLAVRDSSLVLLLDGRTVALARLSAIQRVYFDGVVEVQGGTLPARTMDAARAASRFPFGITAPAMAALLQRAGQDAPVELGPRAP